jgi:hypothetical protein
VRDALAKDCGAATDVFNVARFEMPLCVAIRFGCDVEIIEALIAHGARGDVSAMCGITPVQVLSQLQVRSSSRGRRYAESVGRRLLKAGGRPSDVDVALVWAWSGNERLACLWEGWLEAQKFKVFLLSSPHTHNQSLSAHLPEGIFAKIANFLLPTLLHVQTDSTDADGRGRLANDSAAVERAEQRSDAALDGAEFESILGGPWGMQQAGWRGDGMGSGARALALPELQPFPF